MEPQGKANPGLRKSQRSPLHSYPGGVRLDGVPPWNTTALGYHFPRAAFFRPLRVRNYGGGNCRITFVVGYFQDAPLSVVLIQPGEWKPVDTRRQLLTGLLQKNCRQYALAAVVTSGLGMSTSKNSGIYRQPAKRRKSSVYGRHLWYCCGTDTVRCMLHTRFGCLDPSFV